MYLNKGFLRLICTAFYGDCKVIYKASETGNAGVGYVNELNVRTKSKKLLTGINL